MKRRLGVQSRVASEPLESPSKKFGGLSLVISDSDQEEITAVSAGASPVPRTIEAWTASGAYYDAAARKGRRRYMQDRVLVQSHVGKRFTVCAVFDGHGDAGHDVAKRAAKRCLTLLEVKLPRITRSNRSMSMLLQRVFQSLHDDIIAAFPHHGGTTCSLFLMDEETLAYWAANVGDSRCILVDAHGSFRCLSQDHVASDPQEIARIESCGGIVMRAGGHLRVQGQMQVSRSLGDAHLQPWLSCTPHITSGAFSPSDRFVCVASDGIWSVLTNEQTSDFLSTLISKDGFPGSSDRLVQYALSHQSSDNLAVVLLHTGFLRGRHRSFTGMAPR